MNVAIFINNLSGKGGTEVVSKEYAFRLLLRNDKVFFITASYDIKEPEFNSKKNLEVFNIDNDGNSLSKKNIEAVLEYCRTTSIDRAVFILNQPRRSGAMSNPRLICLISNICKVEVVFHSSPKSYLTRYWHMELGFFGNILRFVKTKLYVAPEAKLFMNTLMQNNVEVYTICRGCKKEMYDYFGIDSKIRYNTYSFISKKIIEKRNIVTYCGRLEVEKNVLMLLRAWRIANTSGWIFRIIGDGTEKKFLEEFCNRNSIENVEFIGNVSHSKIYDFMAESKILMLGSTNEGFPTVLVEAMNMGNAIITTKFDGMSDELVFDGNSIIVDSFDYKKYAMQLNLLLENQDLVRKMGMIAFDRCKNFYSSEDYLKNLG